MFAHEKAKTTFIQSAVPVRIEFRYAYISGNEFSQYIRKKINFNKCVCNYIISNI